MRRPRYHTGVRSTALAVALSLFAGVTLFAHDLTNHSPSTAVVVFSCPMHPEVTLTQAGACSRCGMKLQSRNTKANEIPHADHNPKHGGSFTMVDDYHMELVEAEEEFRLYLYDALTQPMNVSMVRGELSLQTEPTEKPAFSALLPSSNGAYLASQIPKDGRLRGARLNEIVSGPRLP